MDSMKMAEKPEGLDYSKTYSRYETNNDKT